MLTRRLEDIAQVLGHCRPLKNTGFGKKKKKKNTGFDYVYNKKEFDSTEQRRGMILFKFLKGSLWQLCVY